MSAYPIIDLPETHMPADDFIKLLESLLTGSTSEADLAAEELRSKAQQCQANQAKYGRGQESNN